MNGSDASRLYLRSDAASGVIALGLSATSHSASRRGRRTNPQHGAKKARMKETRLGEKCRGDSHAKWCGACIRRTKNMHGPSAPPCSCGAGLSRPRHAQCTRRDSALTSHVARVVAIDPCSQCVVRGRGVVVFLSGVEQTPVFVWRVVVVGGLCARRREVQIWCGDGPCCGHFT